MPRFNFETTPDDDLYWDVLRAFGLRPSNLRYHGFHRVSSPAFAALDRIRGRILAVYRPCDRANTRFRHPWTKRGALTVLRQFLRTRGYRLENSVRRVAGGGVARVYRVEEIPRVSGSVGPDRDADGGGVVAVTRRRADVAPLLADINNDGYDTM
jgi:hypothetical protein